jgi:Zn-finger domain-containing protein
MPPKVSGKAAKKAGKAQKNIAKGDKKKKRKRKESYAIYIYKVLKQVHPEPRHWHLLQSHDHHEQLRQRHFRAHRWRVVPSCPLQQAVDHH